MFVTHEAGVEVAFPPETDDSDAVELDSTGADCPTMADWFVARVVLLCSTQESPPRTWDKKRSSCRSMI